MVNTRNLIQTAFLLTQENLFLMLIFTFTPLLFPWKLLWYNLNKQFYLVLQNSTLTMHGKKHIILSYKFTKFILPFSTYATCNNFFLP